MAERDRYGIPLAQKDHQIGRPFDTSLPQKDPNLPKLEMAFNRRIRKYWLEVAGHDCQYEFYDERQGWVQCASRASHVHHIKGERETLMSGNDPHQNVGLPLCADHHVRNRSGSEHTRDFAFHPDMGEAYQEYPEWKRQQEHMASISGKKRIDHKNSPFAKAAREHNKKIKKGERYIAGSDEIDQYYKSKMLSLAAMHNARNETKKPDVKQHKDLDKTKRKRWWRHFFES